MQIECPSPVSAPAPLLQKHHHIHTHRDKHLKLTHLPLEGCWHHFSTSLCAVSILHRAVHILMCTVLTFCLLVCYQSLSLSPFTFPPFSDVTPVFHFIPAFCFALINKQMTCSCVMKEGFFECQIIFTCEFSQQAS